MPFVGNLVVFIEEKKQTLTKTVEKINFFSYVDIFSDFLFKIIKVGKLHSSKRSRQ